MRATGSGGATGIGGCGMTEAEWLASDDPIVMLGGVPYRWDRKFRMFALRPVNLEEHS